MLTPPQTAEALAGRWCGWATIERKRQFIILVDVKQALQRTYQKDHQNKADRTN